MLNRNEANLNNNSGLIVDFLEISDINRFSCYSVVIAKMNTQQLVQQSQGKDENEIPKKHFAFPGTTYLSINVFDKTVEAKVPAKVNYSVLKSSISKTDYDVLSVPDMWSNRNVIKSLDYTCQFLDESDIFSTAGCTRVISSEKYNSITCSCNHTTIFAALLSVTSFYISSEIRVRFQLLYCTCIYLNFLVTFFQQLFTVCLKLCYNGILCIASE